MWGMSLAEQVPCSLCWPTSWWGMRLAEGVGFWQPVLARVGTEVGGAEQTSPQASENRFGLQREGLGQSGLMDSMCVQARQSVGWANGLYPLGGASGRGYAAACSMPAAPARSPLASPCNLQLEQAALHRNGQCSQPAIKATLRQFPSCRSSRELWRAAGSRTASCWGER
jgi:hypothetical protein